MEHKNLDRLFQEKFKDFEVKPPEDIWNGIEAELNKKETKRIIPIWWKYSGVAALLVIGTLLYTNFSETNLNSNPKLKTNTDSVVFENTEIKNAQTDSNSLVNKETKSGTNQTNTESISPIANPIRNNQTVTTVDSNKSKKGKSTTQNNTISSLKILDENESLQDHQQSKTKPKNEALVFNSEKTNNQKTELSNHNPNQSTTSETAVVVSESQSEIDLDKYKTAEEINKIKEIDSTVVNAVADANVEPNALEELLKEKEKEEKSEELKVNRWQITSAVAPVYFNSTSNGSPIDSQFENNSKEYENSLTFGVGVQYALSNKVSIRSGLNQVSLGYNTNDIVYHATLGKSDMNTINTSSNVASIIVSNKNDNSTGTFQEIGSSSINTANEGVLNQQIAYLEMPLEVSYKLLDRKFGIQFIGGISTLFLTDNQVMVKSPGFEFDLGEANNLNQVHFSSNVGLGFNYTFWKSFQANFEPMFKYQLNTFSSDAGNFKPYYIGLYSGISYRF